MAQNESSGKWFVPPKKRSTPPTENGYQRRLKKKLEKRYPGCQVDKTDSGSRQGIPDLEIRYGSKWAMLECKRSPKAAYRPNQKERIGEINNVAFARAINPVNENEVLAELDRYFGV